MLRSIFDYCTQVFISLGNSLLFNVVMNSNLISTNVSWLALPNCFHDIAWQADVLNVQHDCDVVILMHHRHGSGDTVTFYGTEGPGAPSLEIKGI